MFRSVLLYWVFACISASGVVRAQMVTDQAGPVQLSIVSAGVGGLGRLGDWAGFQIEFTDQNDTQREVIIQIEGRDSDGDLPMYQRTITTNPGATQRTWLYLWIPGSREEGDPFTVAAYEAIAVDSDTAERTGVRYRRGQLLGRRVVVPKRKLLQPEVASMLVVGKRVGGLIGYSQRAQASDPFLPLGHEVTEIAFDLRPQDLPDRWLGLSEFEVIVWTSASPTDLSTSRAKALTEWVRRGGHLVVCLPPTGQIWQDTTRNELAGLLPDVRIKRLADGSSTVDRLLTHDEQMILPQSLVVQSLEARAAAGRNDAVPILTDREGHVVVSRRFVDLGAVTLIGIDVTNRNLTDRGLPAMDAFWHRVLGRRGRLPDRSMQSSVGLTAREVSYFDAEIGGVISTSGSAGAALLLGFVLFAIYWAIAGPVGYAVLRHFGLKQFAWIGFVASIAFFTAIGWGGVSILRPKHASVKHVTFLDAVDGGGLQRARTFASIFVPDYGDAAVRVGDPLAEATTPFLNAATPWSDGFSSLLTSASFPDSRAYPISARQPDRISFPSRATEKRFRFEWAGEARWAMPRPVSSSGGPGELHLNSANKPVGTLVHHLPGGLRDTIIV
ncbi:MAG TPA: hypothetical protein ENJ00_09805, partial [Phycisphaerales bacterium]|nr:hypothetical protein [Phycisphaerales bacterium]